MTIGSYIRLKGAGFGPTPWCLSCSVRGGKGGLAALS